MNTGTKAETEVTHISSHGVWLLANGRELFHWPELDVDLIMKSIEQPGKYPLIAK